MSNVFVNDKSLTAIANVIRSKNSTENTYKPAEMAGAVAELPSYDFVKNLIERPSTATEIVIPDYVTAIDNGAFSYSPYLTSITIPNSVTNIGAYAFNYCSSLTSITIPNSVTNIGAYAFKGCERLEFVELGQGFNANNPDLSASTKYTRETIVSLLNALKDRTGQAPYKFIIGPENLKKLTAEDIKIATDKNWTIA